MTRANFVLTPAYGRDYSNSQAVLKDWMAQKDFVVNGPRPMGTYTNRQDLEGMKITEVNVRWDRMKYVGVLKYEGATWTIAADDSDDED